MFRIFLLCLITAEGADVDFEQISQCIDTYSDSRKREL